MSNMGMIEFGDLIRNERERRNLRGYDLAYTLGQSPSWLSRVEAGQLTHPPSPAIMQEIADALDLPMASLLNALGYHIGEASPPYDALTVQVLKGTEHWTPGMKALLWRYIDAINEALDERAP